MQIASSIAILLFVLAQIGIGYWASKRVVKEDDYVVAGRKLDLRMAGISIFISWFGAESIMGSSAAIAEDGLAGGRADPLGYALALLLFGIFYAAAIYRTGAMTLVDVFIKRFGVTTSKIAAMVCIPPSILWCAAQLRALGQLVSLQTALTLEVAIVLAAVVAIVYTYLGGLLGDVITDVFQGFIVLVGLVITLIAVMSYFGGVSESIAMIQPEQLSLIGKNENWLERINIWFVPIIGAMVAQENISKSLGCKNAGEAKKAALFAGGLYFLFGLVPVMIGLLGAHFPMELGHSEEFLPRIAQATLHPVLYVFFMGAIVSIIFSTIDTSLLSVGALSGHNIFPTNDEKKQLGRVRMVVILAGIASCIIALSAESIYGLVLEADALGTSGIIIVTTAALFTKWGGPISASSTFIVALVSSVLAKYVFEYEAPFLLSFVLALITFIVLAPVDNWRSKLAY